MKLSGYWNRWEQSNINKVFKIQFQNVELIINILYGKRQQFITSYGLNGDVCHWILMTIILARITYQHLLCLCWCWDWVPRDRVPRRPSAKRLSAKRLSAKETECQGDRVPRETECQGDWVPSGTECQVGLSAKETECQVGLSAKWDTFNMWITNIFWWTSCISLWSRSKKYHLALSLSWQLVSLGTQSPWHSVSLGTRSPWHSVSWELT